MREPYRVAVWGPGVAGQCAIRELIRLPETELVAVFAYSESKNGMDAGTMSGVEPVGIKVTTDLDEFLAVKPEVVLHTARDFADFRADDDIVRMLEAGINVITVLTYQYPMARGEAFHQRFHQAGVKGGATLHGNGIDPGFLYERLAPVMTGISNDIDHIRLEEYFNLKTVTTEMIAGFGFGNTLEEIENNTFSATYAGNYLTMGMHYLADHLGEPITRIERISHHVVSEEGTSVPGVYEIDPGTVGMVSYEWKGYTAEDKPLYQIQVNWYLNDSMRPEAAQGDEFWVMEVEGVPSTRIGLQMKGSIARDELVSKKNPGPAAYVATIIPCIQSIPEVVDAEPGVLVTEMPSVHWKPDMRK